jgi:hypothetical protein
MWENQIGFGDYWNKSVEWLLWHEPGFAVWMVEEGATENMGSEGQSYFEGLFYKAQNLKVPGQCHYCSSPISRMMVTRAHRERKIGKIWFTCSEHIFRTEGTMYEGPPSLCPPGVYTRYDKKGQKIVLSAFKQAFFGSAKYRLTQKRMEAFFNAPDNFTLEWPKPGPATSIPLRSEQGVQLGLFD